MVLLLIFVIFVIVGVYFYVVFIVNNLYMLDGEEFVNLNVGLFSFIKKEFVYFV